MRPTIVTVYGPGSTVRVHLHRKVPPLCPVEAELCESDLPGPSGSGTVGDCLAERVKDGLEDLQAHVDRTATNRNGILCVDHRAQRRNHVKGLEAPFVVVIGQAWVENGEEHGGDPWLGIRPRAAYEVGLRIALGVVEHQTVALDAHLAAHPHRLVRMGAVFVASCLTMEGAICYT